MAAASTPIFSLTVRATAAITQARGVTLAGAVPAAAANGFIARVGGAIGDLLTVDVLGTTIAEAGAAVTAAHVPLEFDAQGRLVTATAGKIVARSVGTAAAAGDMFEVLCVPN